MARKRAMTAKQRAFFGRRTSRRSSARAPARRTSRRSRGGGMMRGWIPLAPREMMVDFALGAIAAPLTAKLQPIQQQYLGPIFGSYADEATLALAGVAAYKFGGGFVRDLGREAFRYAVISAGQQTGSAFVNGLLNGTTGGMSAANDGITVG